MGGGGGLYASGVLGGGLWPLLKGWEGGLENVQDSPCNAPALARASVCSLRSLSFPG